MRYDLNLLPVFLVLMDERSVTRAAARLGITQPALSNALARLLDMLQDPLFIRERYGMQPTQKAEELAPAIAAALASHELRADRPEPGRAACPRPADPQLHRDDSWIGEAIRPMPGNGQEQKSAKRPSPAGTTGDGSGCHPFHSSTGSPAFARIAAIKP